jgi:hypothetical protein
MEVLFMVVNEMRIVPYIKINSRDDAIERVLDTEIETKLTGMYFYVPGQTYYIVSGDNTCGKYATTIISIFIDENGTRIIHKPFETADDSNIYGDKPDTFTGRARFSL